MTKTRQEGSDYGKVKDELLKRVKKVIADSESHRYKVSDVYSAYNEAFGKRDVPQTCSTCLRNRVRELRKWIEGHSAYLKASEAPKTPEVANAKAEGEKSKEEPEMNEQEDGKAKEDEPQYNDPSTPGFVPPAPGVTRVPMVEGLPFDFTPSDSDKDKGTVKLADGNGVKAGTYTAACGWVIAVQPGGKATTKRDDEVIEDLT